MSHLRAVAFGLLPLMLLLCGCSAAQRSVSIPPVDPPPAPVDRSNPLVSASPGQLAYAAALDLIRQNKLTEAVAKLETAVQLDPKLADGWNDLSYASLRAEAKYDHAGPLNHPHQFRRAVEAATEALKLKPEWDHALYNLGLAQLASLQYEAAMAPLKRAMELEPDRPEPLVALGLALIGAGRPAEALPLCRTAEAMQTPFLLGQDCLHLLRDGFKRLSDREGAVGYHRLLPGGAASPAPPTEANPEWERVSPNWTCAQQYPDGYRIALSGCQDPAPYAYAFNKSQAGKTPAGIGVGVPWALVAKSYGETLQYEGAYHYVVGDLELVIRGSERQGVTYLGFLLPEPLFVIDRLIHDQTGPEPLYSYESHILGVSIGESVVDVETALGKPERVIAGKDGEERISHGGQLHLFGRDGKVVGMQWNGNDPTWRGIVVGDPVARVQRLYGTPYMEEAASIRYQEGEDSKSVLIFDLEGGLVRGVRVTSQ